MTGLWKGVSDIFEMTGKRKIMAPAVEAIKFSYSAAALTVDVYRYKTKESICNFFPKGISYRFYRYYL